jgi:hypothetical protein
MMPFDVASPRPRVLDRAEEGALALAPLEHGDELHGRVDEAARLRLDELFHLRCGGYDEPRAEGRESRAPPRAARLGFAPERSWQGAPPHDQVHLEAAQGLDDLRRVLDVLHALDLAVAAVGGAASIAAGGGFGGANGQDPVAAGAAGAAATNASGYGFGSALGYGFGSGGPADYAAPRQRAADYDRSRDPPRRRAARRRHAAQGMESLPFDAPRAVRRARGERREAEVGLESKHRTSTASHRPSATRSEARVVRSADSHDTQTCSSRGAWRAWPRRRRGGRRPSRRARGT